MKRTHLGAATLALALAACGNATPPPKETTPIDAAVTATASASSPAPSPPDAGPVADLDAGGEPDAAAVPAPVVADNKVEPTEGPELLERARALLEAVARDEPERAEALWFPKEPFIPLKDVKDPGKYWEQLHRAYRNDIHALHKKRSSWDHAELVGFAGWSHPKWVKPGDEANHIGYYRAFNGKLRYRAGGEEGELEVHTMITWQGRWYCTHLRKIKR